MHTSKCQQVVGRGEPSLELSLRGGSWREASGEGSGVFFSAGAGKAVGTSLPATETSGQMCQPNYETVQGGKFIFLYFDRKKASSDGEFQGRALLFGLFHALSIGLFHALSIGLHCQRSQNSLTC